MSAVFISHSSHDTALAMEVADRLHGRHHHSVFLDVHPEDGIVGGQNWERTLYRKLRACRAVIAVCTDHSLRSHWCFAELALARMEGKPVLSVLAEPLAPDARLPALITERQVIDLRGDATAGWSRLWRALEQINVAGLSTSWAPGRSPYLGLSAYQEEDAAVFFGREDETLAGVELLDRGAPGFIMVLGASGSGKSSLVRAGIVPRLRVREDWLVLDPFRPGTDPWAELTESLVRAYSRCAPGSLDHNERRRLIREQLTASHDGSADIAAAERGSTAGHEQDDRVRRLIDLLRHVRDDPPHQLPDRLRSHLDWTLDDLQQLAKTAAANSPVRLAGPTRPLVALADDLRRLSEHRPARVLVVVDQFEELLGDADGSRAAADNFLTLLRAAAETEHSPVTVLSTMRSDFLGIFQRHGALHGLDFESLSLGPMRVDGMRRVIEVPARLAAIELEDGLADRLLADTATSDALPLLSFALSVMCRDRGDQERLTIAAYKQLGGLQQTVAREADTVLATATREENEHALRAALLQMARLTEDGSYARKPLDWNSRFVQPVEHLLATLVDRRVLVSRMEGDRRVIEVAHEALFRTWAPLRSWLTNARADLLLKQQLERDAASWLDAGRRADALWRGGRLVQAREMLDSDGVVNGEAVPVREFVRSGIRRQSRQRFTVTTLGLAVLVVLVGFLVFSLNQAARARAEQRRALDLARVAIADDWLPRDPTSAALVLAEVTDPDHTRSAPRLLRDALSRGFAVAEYRHDGAVNSVAINPDGTRVLTTSGTVASLWEAHSGRLLHALRHDYEVVAGTFDPAGRLVVTRAGVTGAVFDADRPGSRARVWDAESGAQRFDITQNAQLNDAIFNVDGRWLATRAANATVQLWDVRSGRVAATLPHPLDVVQMAFDAAGTRLVTVAGGVVRVWQTGSMGSSPLHAIPASADAAGFSPDGQFLVTVGGPVVQVWDTTSWQLRHSLEHRSAGGLAFSRDGQQLVTRASNSAMVWNVRSGTRRFVDPIAQNNLEYAGFNDDGSIVITASGHPTRQGYGRLVADNTIRFWSASNGELRQAVRLAVGAEVTMVAFDASRQRAVLQTAHRIREGGSAESFRYESSARLWATGFPAARPDVELPHQTSVSHVAFSSDGRHLLTVAGRSIHIWDAAAANLRFTLGHDHDVLGASFSADGGQIVSAARDGTARVWDAQTGRERFRTQHDRPVDAALLVAGGRFLATVSGELVRLWRPPPAAPGTSGPVLELPGVDPTGENSWSDNFSPDGRLAVTRSDRTAALWDVALRRVRFRFEHEGQVRFIKFIADGRLLVTGGDEPVVRIWNTATGEVVHQLLHEEHVRALAVSRDSRTVVTLDRAGAGHLWHVDTGTRSFTLPHGCEARSAWFIAGSLVATHSLAGTEDCERKVVMWDVVTGASRGTVVFDADQAEFSPDASLLYTRGEPFKGMATDDSVRVWDASTAEERFAEPFRARTIGHITWSPDSSRLAIASGGTVTLWVVGGRELQAAMAAHTSVCLGPGFRRQNLGETGEEAERAFDDCERRHGRR